MAFRLSWVAALTVTAFLFLSLCGLHIFPSLLAEDVISSDAGPKGQNLTIALSHRRKPFSVSEQHTVHTDEPTVSVF